VLQVRECFGHPDALNPVKGMERVRVVTGISDFDPKVHKISQWVMDGVIADKFRAGRVFVLGDAAHRHAPVGGLGLNSAVQDAYNLSWKLAAVLAGRAGDGLLDTYETERRPVDQANLDTAVKGARNRTKIDLALGRAPGRTAGQMREDIRPLFEDPPNSAERRHQLNLAVASQTMEFRQHGVDFGYSYRSAAVVDDGSAPPVQVDAARLYQPSTKPGHSLPHAWVVGRSGERFPLGSLVHGGHFALIAGEDGRSWMEAAEKLAAARDIPLRAARVGLHDSDLIDIRLAWLKHRGISPAGAVLVRPDRFIGFR
jgi:2,4-dichlorophenol 6-monooxygenase